jgi:CRP/FNR family putative post-exponential-phase nitrogen-starvation transcriptional regulator
MEKLLDETILNFYINKHDLHQIFESDVLSHAELHSFQKGEQILKVDSQLIYYYFFVKGKIKVFSPQENGKSLLLRFYTTFDTLGDLELFRKSPVRSNVEAAEDTLLIALPTEILHKLCNDNPVFLRYVINSLSIKLDSISYNSAYNLLYPLINRLCSYLIEHVTDEDFIYLTSSYEDISDFLGTTYRHLHRTLNQLQEKKILAFQGKKIYILNRDELKKLSKNLYR